MLKRKESQAACAWGATTRLGFPGMALPPRESPSPGTPQSQVDGYTVNRNRFCIWNQETKPLQAGENVDEFTEGRVSNKSIL